MSIIRTAFTSATTGALSTVAAAANSLTSAAEAVDIGAQSLKQIAKVGLHNATNWAEAAEEDTVEAKIERKLIRHDERTARIEAIALSAAKRQEKLNANPEAKAIFNEMMRSIQPSLRVAAE